MPELADNETLSLRCTRCGAPLPTLAQLATVAAEADRAMRERKLAAPTLAASGLHEVAQKLPCHAGTCGGPRAG